MGKSPPIFRLIDRTDHHLILANLLFLFFVAAIPFPTALMADYLGQPAERVGIIVYSGWFLLTALSYNLLWSYASTGNRLVAPAANPATVRAITSRFNLGPPAYGLPSCSPFSVPRRAWWSSSVLPSPTSCPTTGQQMPTKRC